MATRVTSLMSSCVIVTSKPMQIILGPEIEFTLAALQYRSKSKTLEEKKFLKYYDSLKRELKDMKNDMEKIDYYALKFYSNVMISVVEDKTKPIVDKIIMKNNLVFICKAHTRYEQTRIVPPNYERTNNTILIRWGDKYGFTNNGVTATNLYKIASTFDKCMRYRMSALTPIAPITPFAKKYHSSIKFPFDLYTKEKKIMMTFYLPIDCLGFEIETIVGILSPYIITPDDENVQIVKLSFNYDNDQIDATDKTQFETERYPAYLPLKYPPHGSIGFKYHFLTCDNKEFNITQWISYCYKREPSVMSEMLIADMQKLCDINKVPFEVIQYPVAE